MATLSNRIAELERKRQPLRPVEQMTTAELHAEMAEIRARMAEEQSAPENVPQWKGQTNDQ